MSVAHATSAEEHHLAAEQSRAAGARAAAWLSVRAVAYVGGWLIGNITARTYYAVTGIGARRR